MTVYGKAPQAHIVESFGVYYGVAQVGVTAGSDALVEGWAEQILPHLQRGELHTSASGLAEYMGRSATTADVRTGEWCGFYVAYEVNAPATAHTFADVRHTGRAATLVEFGTTWGPTTADYALGKADPESTITLDRPIGAAVAILSMLIEGVDLDPEENPPLVFLQKYGEGDSRQAGLIRDLGFEPVPGTGDKLHFVLPERLLGRLDSV